MRYLYTVMIRVLLSGAFFVSQLSADVVQKLAAPAPLPVHSALPVLPPVATASSQNAQSSLSLDAPDVDIIITGKVREEFFYLDKAATLQDAAHDTYHFLRNRAQISLHGVHGKRTYGHPAAMAKITFAVHNYWSEDSMRYTSLRDKNVDIDPCGLRKAVTLSSHTHQGTVPLLYQEEAWLNIDFDAFVPRCKLPTSFKIGYFPYKVGRGLALGDYVGGAVAYLGWGEDAGCGGNATQNAPGMLFQIELSQKAALELYYSKWKSQTATPVTTRFPVNMQRLDLPFDEADPARLERGTKSDTELFAAKFEYNSIRLGGNWHIEPYWVYVNAPELTVEVTGDAATRLGTIGCMTEFVAGRLSVNAEVAFQYGKQEVFALDRNVRSLLIDDDFQESVDVEYRNVFLGSTAAHQADLSSRAWFNKALEDALYLPINRYAGANGKQIMKANGKDPVLIGANDDKPVYNGELPFAGIARFRKGYTLSHSGFMAVGDIMLSSKEGNVRIAAAAAWISGDKYPYNTEVNKSYSGFVPLRDQNYFGHYVRSFAMLYARKLPRPVDMSDTKMYAFNDDESMTNLRYIGLGLQWHPLKNKRELIIMPALFSYWEDCPPKKWGKAATRDFGNAYTNAAYLATQSKLGFSGAALDTAASSSLGMEVSLSAVWNFVKNCELSAVISGFLPGQLYEDVQGMPNRNVRRIKPNNKTVYGSLGTQMALGGTVRLTFQF